MAKLTLHEEFNVLGGPWEPMYPWSPDGWASDLSWLGNPNLLPPDDDPISLANGIMTLADSALPADVTPDQTGGLARIGGQILTQDTFSQTYGYFEASLKMPAGDGENGAFWLLPQSGAWPPELDIAEVEGEHPTLLTNTIHTSDGTPDGNSEAAWTIMPSDLTTGYNTYAVDWTPTTITWYFDGMQTFQVNTPSDMNQPMYVVLSTNDSGDGGAPPASAQMNIDWVHVYNANPYTTGGLIAAQPAPSAVDPPPAAGTDIVDVALIGATMLTAPTGPAVFVYDGSGQNTVISGFNPFIDKIDFEMTTQDISGLSIAKAADGSALVDFNNNQINLLGVIPEILTTNNFLIDAHSVNTT